MEIYNLNYAYYKMFNPTTGGYIIDEYCDDDAKDLIAYWLGDFEHFNDESLKQAWESYEERINKGKRDIYFNWKRLIKFLKAYQSDEWIAYKITSSGVACGMVSYTTVYVVHKNVEVVEVMDEDDEMDVEGYDEFIIT